MMIIFAFFFGLCFGTLLNPYKFTPPGDNGYHYTAEQLEPQKFNENPYENSGYIEVNEKDKGFLFHIFFESQDGNHSAPIVMWLQGGPGSSSLLGCFAEMGPYSVDVDSLKIEKRAHSWNEKFHMLFVDNPVGAGFSYVENEEGYVETEEEVADQLYTFLTKFFELHPQYKTNELYIFGESYAGKYVPAISHKIQAEGYEVNLKGLGIGDGLTHPEDQFERYMEWALVTGNLDINNVAAVAEAQNKSVEAIKNEDWASALDYWGQVLDIIEKDSGNVNLYDIRCHESYDFTHISKYCNLDQTKELMHTTGHDYHSSSQKAHEHLALDMPKSVLPWLIDLVNDQRLKVLIYNGQFDMIIPVESTVIGYIWEMDWNHKKEFQKSDRKVWKVGKEFAGWKRSFEGLYAVIVANAGHLSPMDQIEATQDMVTKFIYGW